MKVYIGSVVALIMLLFSGNAFSVECDINSDGKTGLEEAIYALQVAAGVYPDGCSGNSECKQDYYCAKPDGACNGYGFCTEVPEACPDIWDPVCGCDGFVYGNSCEAAAAGVNIFQKGECRDTRCDDTTPVLCMMIQPICSEYEILAVQNNCWVCVNAATCNPWGTPGCRSDEDCPEGTVCDPCGTSSCPVCDDCLPACRVIETRQ